MGHLSAEQTNWLTTTFGDRMTTRRVERKLYSHDVGEMPLLIKPLIGTPMADAVVQPTSEEEIVALVKWAVANHIPLVPRGKATSGYGGVLPVNFNTNGAGLVRKGQFLCLGPDENACVDYLMHSAGVLPVTWTYDRD